MVEMAALHALVRVRHRCNGPTRFTWPTFLPGPPRPSPITDSGPPDAGRVLRSVFGASCQPLTVRGPLTRMGVAHRDDVADASATAALQLPIARAFSRVSVLRRHCPDGPRRSGSALPTCESGSLSVGPVEAGVLRIAHRQVAREAVVDALLREGPARADEPLLQVLAMRRRIREHGKLRERSGPFCSG